MKESSLHIEKTKLAGVLLITPPTVFEDFQLAGEFFAAHNCLLKNGRKTNRWRNRMHRCYTFRHDFDFPHT